MDNNLNPDRASNSASEAIYERLLSFIRAKHINKFIFEQKTGVGGGYMSRFENPKIKTLERIVRVYPELSFVWLVTGQGSMFANNHTCPGQTPDTHKHPNADPSEIAKLHRSLDSANRQIALLAATNETLRQQLDLLTRINSSILDCNQVLLNSLKTQPQ